MIDILKAGMVIHVSSKDEADKLLDILDDYDIKGTGRARELYGRRGATGLIDCYYIRPNWAYEDSSPYMAYDARKYYETNDRKEITEFSEISEDAVFLRNCPFCGSDDVHLNSDFWPHKIYCLKCNAELGGAIYGFGPEANARIVEAWNRRSGM